MGVKFWFISGGGEPMLRKRPINFLIKKIKKYKWNIGYMSTNLTTFNEKDIKSFIFNKWDILDVKLNHSLPIDNDKIVGSKGAFSKLMRNLKLFNEFKKKYKSKFPRIYLGILAHNKNFKDFNTMVKLGIKAGVDEILLSCFHIHNLACRSLVLDKAQEAELMMKIKNAMTYISSKKIPNNFSDFIENKYPLFIDYVNRNDSIDKITPESNSKRNKTICLMPWTNISVFADASYGPCCTMKFDDKIKNGNLIKAWSSNNFSDLRKRILLGEPISACKNCPVYLTDQNKDFIGLHWLS